MAEFTPGAPGEEQWAREASAYVPHVFMRQNDGFRILYWMIKDALMYRLGAVTVDLEDYSEKRRVPVQGLPQDAIDMVVAQAAEEGAELAMELEQDEAPRVGSPSRAVARDLSLRRRRLPSLVRSPSPTSASAWWPTTSRPRTSCSRRRRATRTRPRSWASASGSPRRTWSRWAFARTRSTSSAPTATSRPRRAQRNDGAVLGEAERDGLLSDSGLGDSERPLWLVVAYVRADQDGDGVSELLRVVYAHAGGTAGRIVERVEWDGIASIALASPILMSHTIVGRSLFDQTQDLQQIGSVLTRGLLDNLYITNRPRPVISDQVNLDSLIDWVPGSPIRLKAGRAAGRQPCRLAAGAQCQRRRAGRRSNTWRRCARTAPASCATTRASTPTA